MMLALMKATTFTAILSLALPTALAQKVPGPVNTEVVTIKTLAADLAVRAGQAAIDACSAQNISAVVVIVDSEGNTRLIMVGDGGNLNLVEGARRKAYTAATLRGSTLLMQKALAANPHMFVRPDSQVLLVGGGLPIYAGSQIVGGIGVEGGKPAAEDQCAQAGLDKLQTDLHPEPPQPGARPAASPTSTPSK